MSAPTEEDVQDYLGPDTGWSTTDIGSAYSAEKAAQAARCRVPADDAEWPADLVEALKRRVAVNLALRSLPLGLQALMSEGGVAQTRVGGGDSEVRRLEAPHRRLVVG